MNIEAVKSALISLAIRGKLVPQRDDEPAVEQIGDVPKEAPFEIPAKWKWVKIKNVFHLQAGKFIQAKDIASEPFAKSFPCYGGNGLRGFVKQNNREGTFPLIGRQGALCGNVNMASGKFYATEHAVVVDVKEFGDPYCVGFFLRAMNLNQYATATAQPGLSVKKIVELYFPLPPLAEQRRIVAKLDELLEPLTRVQERLGTLTHDFPEKFKAAVLQKAIQGKLVPQRADEPAVEQIGAAPKAAPFEIPAKWKWAKISSTCSSLVYGTAKKSQATGAVPVIRMGNLQDGKIDWGDLVYSSDAPDIKKFMLHRGDVLFNRTNSRELVGKTSIYDSDRPAIFAGYLIRLNYDKNLITGSFLNFVMNSTLAKDYCAAVRSNGVGQANISAKKIGNFFFPLPPLAEQRRIVAKVEQLFSQVDELTARLSS